MKLCFAQFLPEMFIYIMKNDRQKFVPINLFTIVTILQIILYLFRYGF